LTGTQHCSPCCCLLSACCLLHSSELRSVCPCDLGVLDRESEGEPGWPAASTCGPRCLASELTATLLGSSKTGKPELIMPLASSKSAKRGLQQPSIDANTDAHSRSCAGPFRPRYKLCHQIDWLRLPTWTTVVLYSTAVLLEEGNGPTTKPNLRGHLQSLHQANIQT
jgi:hypothetical protein